MPAVPGMTHDRPTLDLKQGRGTGYDGSETGSVVVLTRKAAP